MEELLRTNDPALVPYAQALLDAEDIDCFIFDVNMSILEGSLGILPRRVMVRSADLYRARLILRDNGIEPYEAEAWI
ncbi:MAG TPA: DUF2007 domain-containing protein [Thermohalobaculum sp.]|nr:DUF2007 domain-containing protein [Thermohalobaculum sp.]